MDSQSVDGQVQASIPEVWVSISQLAALKKVSKQAISTRVKKLAGEKLITTRKDGRELKVNIVEFDRAIGANTDPAQMLRNPGGIAMPSMPAGETPPATEEKTPKSPGYMVHKELSASYQAENDRLDLEERLKRTCDTADVEARTFGVFRRLRDRALSFSSTCAPRLANAPDERAMRMIIDEEMRKLLAALSKDLDNPDLDAVELEDEAVEEPADASAPVQ